MSETEEQHETRTRVRRHRDSGMTLPELLIAVLLMGTLVAAMAVATTVVVRQSDNSEGRLNNSRSEQSVSFWVPTDLASAEVVNQEANASPCGAQCPTNVNVGGSNALMLSWQSSTPGATEAIITYTKVSYRYVQIGDEFVILRVECNSVGAAAPTCSQNVLLHDVNPPPTGQPWIPGTTKPTWVMVVSLALDPGAIDDGSTPSTTTPVDPTLKTKNGRRVTVTINGGGDMAGAGGGVDRITLSAGGTERKSDLSTTNLSDPPTFTSTRSRCGGNFGMIVDTSGSIGSTNMTSVNNGIRAFIDSFAGTPIKLQIVRFQSTATTLGLTAGNESKYYDMLVDADVAALKTLVSTMTSTGGTNWEDGFVRMFRKSTGSVQDVLPNTLIFFTDGIPTTSRINSTSMPSVSRTAHPDDAGFSTSVSGNFQQVAWNRTNRVAREFEPDLERFVGVYVGSDTTGSSTWLTRGAGYHLESFQRGYRLINHERGYNVTTPQRGYRLINHERGYTITNPQRGYQLINHERGYHWEAWQRGSHTAYQRATTNISWQQKVSGSWQTRTWAQYVAGNTNNGTNDNWRTTTSGTPGGWTDMTASEEFQYALSNTTSSATDGSDGYKLGTNPAYFAPYTTWTSTTETLFNSGNTTADDTDGWRATAVYTAPYSLWASTTSTLFNAGNTTADSTDGWRATVSYTAPYSLWENSTATTFYASNTTADESDGWRGTYGYVSPYAAWMSVTESAFNAGNTTADSTDGWRATVSYTSPYSLWENTTSALYSANNTTADSSDGWRGTNAYSAPYDYWEATTETLFNSGNTTADSTDGWRATVSYTTPYALWETATETAYNTSNTSWGDTDGWRAVKVYTLPYTLFENTTSTSKTNTNILGELITTGAWTPAAPAGGPYTNADVADMYVLPNWNQFAGALNSLALNECGGTLTVQTKVGTTAAADPFSYLNSKSSTYVTTSSLYKSGTFDFKTAIPISVTLTTQNVTGLERYTHVSWACKSGGVTVPVTTAAVAGSPWPSATVTVSPNSAISCVQTVALT